MYSLKWNIYRGGRDRERERERWRETQRERNTSMLNDNMEINMTNFLL
jgi:hypothetical protein